MKPLYLSVLGGFLLCDASGKKIEIAGTKAALLLSYLVLRPGEFHSREALIALLWGDRDDHHARGSLRQALWSLRRSLKEIEPEALVIEIDTVAVNPAAITSDVYTLETLSKEGSQNALEEAASLYKGELLRGIRIVDTAFEDFLRGERMRVHELAVDVYGRLLDSQLATGLMDCAVRTAKQLLDIDPLQEVAHRTLMQHYASAGQVSLAAKQYQNCCEIYRRELNVEPGTETKRLFDRIRFSGANRENIGSRLDRMTQQHNDDKFSQHILRQKPSIAVLPFLNLSGDVEQEYFSDGITEDIIAALSKLRWFFVIARNSSFVYKGAAVDVRQVGKELGVGYVLEGSLRKTGNRVRVTVELVDAKLGVQHWAQTYDYELTDIFKLQDEITQSVTAAIEPKLVAAESVRSLHRSHKDLEAWDLVMRALSHYWRMTTRDSERAIGILRQTVAQFPDYGPAHSLLAFALLVSGHVGWWINESEDNRYAAQLAHRAQRLDDEDPWAHLALGYLSFTERQTGESVSQYMRALDLNPNFAIAYGYLGWALVFDAQSEEAIRYFQRALRMSPRDPLKAFFYSGTGVAHYYAHRYHEAVKWARKAISERPGFTAAHRILCASLAQDGRTKETRSAMTRLYEVQPNISIAWIEQYVPYTARAMPHFIDGMRKAGLD